VPGPGRGLLERPFGEPVLRRLTDGKWLLKDRAGSPGACAVPPLTGDVSFPGDLFEVLACCLQERIAWRQRLPGAFDGIAQQGFRIAEPA